MARSVETSQDSGGVSAVPTPACQRRPGRMARARWPSWVDQRPHLPSGHGVVPRPSSGAPLRIGEREGLPGARQAEATLQGDRFTDEVALATGEARRLVLPNDKGRAVTRLVVGVVVGADDSRLPLQAGQEPRLERVDLGALGRMGSARGDGDDHGTLRASVESGG